MALPSKNSLTFYERMNVYLAIFHYSSVAVDLTLRGFTKNDMISVAMTTVADRTRQTAVVYITDFPFALNLYTTTTTVRRGQLWAKVVVFVGGQAVCTLMEGYVSYQKDLTYPAGSLQDGTVDQGIIRSITGTDPAANTECSEAVPTNARWKIYGVMLTLTTDANAANRRVNLIIDDGTTELQTMRAKVDHTASVTRYYYYGRYGFSDTAFSNTRLLNSIPELMLFQGWRIRTSTELMQAGDNYGAPQLYVEEWLED